LSKAVLWMSRNPTKVGFDVTVTEKAMDALLRPVAIKIRPQVDVSDVQIYNQQILVKAVSRLPVAPDPWQKPVEPEKAYVKRAEVLEVEEELSVEDSLIFDLIDALSEGSAKPISVVGWGLDEREKSGIDDETWLLYAASQLNFLRLKTEFVLAPKEMDEFNDRFIDVKAHPGHAQTSTGTHR